MLGDWTAFLNGIIGDFAAAVFEWRSEFDALFRAWQQTDETNAKYPYAQANALRYQMSALYETTVIEALADQQFMPRYGFPIGTQRLRVIVPDAKRAGRFREEDQYRLERSGLVAIGEYVPGSQLLVGGKLVTSHGLLKHWTGADINNYLGLRGQYTTCVNRHFYYRIAADSLGACPICGGDPEKSSTNFLLPMHGFSSAAWDPPKVSTNVDRVGHTEQATVTFIQREGADIQEQESFGAIPGLRALYRATQLLADRANAQHARAYREDLLLPLSTALAESAREQHVRCIDLIVRNLNAVLRADKRFPSRCSHIMRVENKNVPVTSLSVLLISRITPNSSGRLPRRWKSAARSCWNWTAAS